jgi:DNA polymerase
MIILENQPPATIDFETRSTADLKKMGSWLYSKHPTTEAMCLSYRLPFWPEGEVKRWHMAHPLLGIEETPLPQDLFDWITSGGLVEAHNSFFERVIWLNVMVARRHWPRVDHLQWRCSASRCSAASLPRSLEMAAVAMDLDIQKDMDGRRLMLKMCKPRQMRKDEIAEWWEATGLDQYPGELIPRSKKDPRLPIVFHETVEDLERLWEYCDADVLTEEAVSSVVPQLPAKELLIWQLDQQMNETGVKFDLEMASSALEMAAEWKKVLNSELNDLTGIPAATRRQALKDWLLEVEKVEIPDTTAETVTWFIENAPMTKRARRVLSIIKQVNKTSTAKYQAMIDRTDPDDWRARDLLMYAGAGTMRWTGKGIQVQNFPRGKCENAYDGDKGYFDPDTAAETILDRDLYWAYATGGDVMELLSTALRSAIISGKGRDLIVADYSAIEARVVLWLAGAEKALQVFRTGGDIYCDMAEGIYGYPVSKKTHKDERQFGKQAILGLGYGMGWLTFFLTCRKYGIKFSVEQVKKIVGLSSYNDMMDKMQKRLFPEHPGAGATAETMKRYTQQRRQAAKERFQISEARENPREVMHELVLMQHTVNVYRARYPEVKALWKAQEDAAIAAVNAPGEYIECGRITWRVDLDDPMLEYSEEIDTTKGFLRCILPSGRATRYRSPKIKPTKTSWGEVRDALRYMSVVTGNKWASTATYGGKIVENITQAVARDIMAEAMLNTTKPECPYDVRFTVHDELVAEVDENEGSLQEFEELLSDLPPWADGCPIVAEAERFKRYRK